MQRPRGEEEEEGEEEKDGGEGAAGSAHRPPPAGLAGAAGAIVCTRRGHTHAHTLTPAARRESIARAAG